MKKSLIIMLAILLCAAVFAGCADNGSTNEATKDEVTETAKNDL